VSVPGWAAQLAPELDADLVRGIVTCAVARPPERLRAVLAGRLERNASTDVGEVVAELAGPVPAGVQAQVERAALALLRDRARVLAVGRAGYPPALATAWPELGAPAWLFASGMRADGGPAVAVVGTRRPTADGLRTAHELGAFLAAAGVCVVSGLARGIDQAAHRGALSAGGTTVAVLGTGFGVDYPARDGGLRAAIAQAGALVTEYAPATPPRPSRFLWRNRIISGLSEAVVVVEGLTRSGALHTARLAAAQGREVFGVPGSLHAPASSGPLALVRDGARVLTRFDDVLEALPTPVPRVRPRPPGMPGPAERAAVEVSPAAQRVEALLGAQPTTPDELAMAGGLPVAAVLAALGELGDLGLARRGPRGYVAEG